MSRGHSQSGETVNPTKVVARVVVLTALALSYSTDVAAKSTTRLEAFRSCTKKNGANIGYFISRNFTVHKTKNHGMAEGDVQILKNMKPPLPADIAILRCRNSAGKECVSLLKYRHHNICPFLVPGSSNGLWKDFMAKFDPPLNCPAEQGDYKVRNGTFDEEKFATYFQGVPGQQDKVTYFVLKVHSKVNDEDLLCLEITFRQVRS